MFWGNSAADAPTAVLNVARETRVGSLEALPIACQAGAASIHTAVFESSRTPLSISGQIVDALTGLPLIGAVVAAPETTAVSDAGGNFIVARRATLLTAPAALTVTMADYAPLPVSLAWGAEGAVLRMTRASGVSIQVLDEQTREAVLNYAVAVVSTADQLAAEAGRAAVPWIRHPGSVHPAGIEWLGSSGLGGLANGDYLVVVTPYGAAYAASLPVAIHVGPQHAQATILVAPIARTTVKVFDAEGRPASSLKVEIGSPHRAGEASAEPSEMQWSGDEMVAARGPAARFGHAFTGRDGEAVFLLPKGSDVVLGIFAEGRRLLTAKRSVGLLDHERIELYLHRGGALGERSAALATANVTGDALAVPATTTTTSAGAVHGGARLDLADAPVAAATAAGEESGPAASSKGAGEDGGLATGNLLNANLSPGAPSCVPCANRRRGSFENLGGGNGLTMATAGSFQLGGELDWTVSGATPGTMLGFTLLGLGSSPTSIETLLPQCQGTLHVRDPIAILCPANSAGATAATLWVPPDQGFCGVRVTGQYAEMATGVCPVRMSDAGAIMIGN